MINVSPRHILEQGPVLAGLGKTALGAVKQRVQKKSTEKPALPGSVVSSIVAPRSESLIDDYIRVCGGESRWYGRNVPAHLFPQWAFPVAGKTLDGIPYPIASVVNGGCRLEINGPIPRGEKIRTQAQLVDIDDNGRRAVMKQRIVTGTERDPAALIAYLFPIVPLKGGSKSEKSEKSEKPTVPSGARELCRMDISGQAGLEFALVTGDFNPIHWLPPYARAFGFRGVILHGFATMARAIEGLNRHLFNGDPTRLRVFDCQFTRPLHIPANVGLYVTDDRQVIVGDAPGGTAYLRGNFESA